MPIEPSILKEDINKLPLLSFSGNIHLIDQIEDVAPALEKLADYDVLGFDTETRPVFKKGQSYPVALLQLATNEEAYLFRLNKVRFSAEMADFLERPQLKVGVAVKDDFIGLQKLHPFEPKGVLDLGLVARNNGLKAQGLRNLMALCYGKRMSKGAKVTNWAAPELSPQQIQYAAIDAWAGLQIHKRFLAEGFNMDLKKEKS